MSTGRNQMSEVVTKSPANREANVEPRVWIVLQRQALCLPLGAIMALLKRSGNAPPW